MKLNPDLWRSVKVDALSYSWLRSQSRMRSSIMLRLFQLWPWQHLQRVRGQEAADPRDGQSSCGDVCQREKPGEDPASPRLREAGIRCVCLRVFQTSSYQVISRLVVQKQLGQDIKCAPVWFEDQPVFIPLSSHYIYTDEWACSWHCLP